MPRLRLCVSHFCGLNDVWKGVSVRCFAYATRCFMTRSFRNAMSIPTIVVDVCQLFTLIHSQSSIGVQITATTDRCEMRFFEARTGRRSSVTCADICEVSKEFREMSDRSVVLDFPAHFPVVPSIYWQIYRPNKRTMKYSAAARWELERSRRFVNQIVS